MRVDALFVYGTLKDPKVQLRVIGRTVEGTADALSGYAKLFVPLGDGIYPMAVPEQGSVIEGLCLLLSPVEFEWTDAYEGPEYRRVRRTLASGRTAWVYVASHRSEST